MALLIALIFKARFFDFRRHHASEPLLIVGLMGALAVGFSLGEGAALLRWGERQPPAQTHRAGWVGLPGGARRL